MIHGIGCDIVEIHRLQNKQEAVAKKILTTKEHVVYLSLKGHRQLEFLAGRFAAKEAIFKALSSQSITISQIEVVNDANGKPTCCIQGYTIHVSIAHEKEYAIAYAVCEK